MTRSAHASCWVAGPESEAMWRLYGQENICDISTLGHTVALQSTLGKIESSVAQHDLFVSPIRYRTYHEGEAFDDDLDMFMHKRLGFRHECEVRFLKYDRGHRDQLMNALINDSPPPPELSEHVYLGWPSNFVVESILISPYADEAYEEKVRAEIKLIDADFEKLLALSILSERRFAPQF